MAGGSLRLVLETPENPDIVLETAVDVQEVRKLDAYLKRLFGNPKIRVVPRPKKDDSAEVYIGEEFIGVLFVDDEDDDRSFQFQMAILEDDLVEQGGVYRLVACYVIASQRVGAKRRPMTGSAKQSIGRYRIVPKLVCFVAYAPVRKRFAFVAGNDGTLQPSHPLGPCSCAVNRSIASATSCQCASQ